MSVIDKFLDAMRLNEEDDEFYNDEYDYEEEEVEEVKNPVRLDKKKKVQESSRAVDSVQKQRQRQQTKITPIRNKKQGATGMEVCVIKPSAIEDETEIAETLLNGRTVVINMEGLSVEVAQRIIDFTSGATFAMHGNLQKISSYIFLAAPNGTDISGDIDIQNLMDSFNISRIN